MKKLLVSLLAVAIVCSFAAPVMADGPTSPVKDYNTAEDGELLYALDFSGKGNVLNMRNLGGKFANEYFDFTPSEDGTSLTVIGRNDADNTEYCAYYGCEIDSLKAGTDTTYTLTYKIKNNNQLGRDNSCGVGAYFKDGNTGDGMKAYHLYGNYTTSNYFGDVSMRRTSLSINNMKQKASNKPDDYIWWNTLPDYEIDEDGFISVMLVYDGPSYTISAYIAAAGAGDGSNGSDWINVENLDYSPSAIGADAIGFMMYAYYVETVDVTVKDAKLYKGKIFTGDPILGEEPDVTEPTYPTTSPTTSPTTKPTTPTTKPSTGSSNKPDPPLLPPLQAPPARHPRIQTPPSSPWAL